MSGATLFSGGPVFTGRRYVEALLVEGERVVAAGSQNDVARLAPTGTEHRRLGGNLVVPGLADAHVHLAEVARVRDGLDLSAASSLEELLRTVTSWAERHPEGPLVGRGFDPERFPDRRWPTRHELDPVVPDRPALLVHASGHAGVANGPALKEAGLDGRSPEGRSASVGRFPDGTPNGVVYEERLRSLAAALRVGGAVPREALERTVDELAAYGVVAVGAMNVAVEEAEALRQLALDGRLPIHVHAYVGLSSLGAVPSQTLRDPVAPFRVVGVKAFLDGAFGPRTASLSAPYADDPTTSGTDVGTDAGLAARLAEAAGVGLAPALHAIGDRAVVRAARLLAAPSPSVLRAPPRIEHAALTPAPVLHALRGSRPALVVQPGFVWSDHWLTARLGKERARAAYLFRTLRDRGFLVAGSSDAPYDPVDPWRGLRAATCRRDPSGRSANPDPTQALPPEEAIRMFASDARAAIGLEGGELEPGAPADLLVLSVPQLSRALALGPPAVAETWVAGRRVPRAPATV